MNTLDLITIAELRAKMGAIPVKLILTAGSVYLMRDGMKEISQYLLIGSLFYTVFSVIWWFVRATANWLIGIILGVVFLVGTPFLYASFYQSHPNIFFEIAFVILFMFGGIILDVWKIFRYFSLVKRLKADAADGYVFDDDEDEYGRADATAQSREELSFFQGCDSLDSLKRRYRDLSRVYHPDNGNGSAEIFAKINNEYELLMEKYS